MNRAMDGWPNPLAAGAVRDAPGWRVIKTYGAAEGLSCCFRQWQAAESHCRFLHGYALGFRFTFAAADRDGRGWVLDFGGLKTLRAWLHDMFDHTLLVAADDPALPEFRALSAAGLAQLREVDEVGCEAFARQALSWADTFAAGETGGRVHCVGVEVREHEGNAAAWIPGLPQP